MEKVKAIYASTPFLLSGLGLVILLLFNFPLYLSLILQFLTLFLLFYLVYKRKDRRSREHLIKIIKTGFLAGVLATAGYDIVRLIIVKVFAFNVWPFEAFKFFGQVIINQPITGNTAYTVGFLYHLLNGITFGIAFFILFPGKHWLYGIIWAFALEIMMLLVYPRFLNIQAFMEEFTIVSSSGHTVYGSVLGLINYYYHKK